MKKNFKLNTQSIAFAYVLLAIIFIGCDTQQKSEVVKKELKQSFYNNNIKIIVVDSCEYLYFPNGNASFGSHKGNCQFCLQRMQK